MSTPIATPPPPITMMGAPGSPYTRKMRALLRYRGIPYRFVIQGSPESAALPLPRVGLLPTFYLPGRDGELEALTDSTPLIRRFETEFSGREAVPPDPAIAFLDELLEDWADEWLTKAMFHYRWAFDADVKKAASILPLWRRIDAPADELAALSKGVAERQISRLYVVGSNETTGSVIEASYARFVRLFDSLLQRQPFLMGARPGASDFAVYGQLTQLALFDPTPAALTLAEGPRVCAWVDLVEDLSGREPGPWIESGAVPQPLQALLGEAGRGYAPVMLANAQAVAEGKERVETRVDDRPWVQKPFPYQAKCLRWLRDSYGKLAPRERTRVDAVLAGSGCEVLFA